MVGCECGSEESFYGPVIMSKFCSLGRLEGAGMGYFPSLRSVRLWKNLSQLGSGKIVFLKGSIFLKENRMLQAYFRIVTFPLPLQKHEAIFL